MRFYLDTEFIEGPVQRRFFGLPVGKPVDTIDLISIAIDSDEEGYSYYRLNKDCDLRRVWKDEWLQKNVLLPIYRQHIVGDARLHYDFTYRTMRHIFNIYGRSREKLKQEVAEFLGFVREVRQMAGGLESVSFRLSEIATPPEIYGYYADYDWVVFCWLFGRMTMLLPGMPMYCRDLKQMLDEKLENTTLAYYGDDLNIKTLEGKLKLIKAHIDYPKNGTEHCANHDARWNRDLYYFIQSLK